MIAGVIAALRGTDAPALEHHSSARITHPQHESSTYRYCTNFAVTGEPRPRADPATRSSASATACSWSATAQTLKVHVHTDEPERATALFEALGTVSRLDVADMHEQVQQR